MRPTLQQLLLLAGRLDDSPGFDTSRERFRRFLTEHVTDPQLARALVEEGQHAIGEQSHCALRDLIVMLGRFLGFETAFGACTSQAGTVRFDGHWRSRRRLHILLAVKTDPVSNPDLDDVARTLAAWMESAPALPEAPYIGMYVLASRPAGRARPTGTLDAEQSRRIRVVSARSLLWLADMVGAGRVEHEDILQLLGSGFDLDLVADLMERCATRP